MDEKVVSMTVGSDVVKPIVEAKIKMAVAEALGGKEQIISDVVGQVLRQKVDSTGKVNSSSCYNDHPFIDIIMGNLIRDAVKVAIKDWVETQKPKIVEILSKKLKTKSVSEKLAGAFLGGLVESLDCSYKFGVNITYQTNKETDY